MLDIHGVEEGLGGDLTADEIGIIRGALDLSHKTAATCMTPFDKARRLLAEPVLASCMVPLTGHCVPPNGPGCCQCCHWRHCPVCTILCELHHLEIVKTWMPTCAQVFMLSADQELNEATLQSILNSGHSRIPIHKPGSRRACRRPKPGAQALHLLSLTSCCAANWLWQLCLRPIEDSAGPTRSLEGPFAHMRAVAGSQGVRACAQARRAGPDPGEGADPVGPLHAHGGGRAEDAQHAAAAR